eukprot:5128565-Pyramimonas_sp.AAC.1
MRGIPNKGKGTDMMNMDDARRLPENGRLAFIDMCNSCEEEVAWPWQTLQAMVMLQPKDAERIDETALTGGGD